MSKPVNGSPSLNLRVQRKKGEQLDLPGQLENSCLISRFQGRKKEAKVVSTGGV